MKNRIAYFDIAKGFTILLVIVGHLDGLPVLAKRLIFSFHMPLFFLISGYFLKPIASKDLLMKRGKELLLPYLYTSMGIILLAILKCLLQGKSIKDTTVVFTQWLWAIFYGSGSDYSNPVYIKLIGAIWFLLALFYTFLIVNWALKYRNTSIIIIGITLLGYYSSKIFWLPFSVQASMVASGFVYLGFLARKNDVLEYIKKTPSITVLCMLIWIIGIACGCGHLYMVANSYNCGVWEFFVAIAATIVVLIISSYIETHMVMCTKILSWLGKNSLYILCLHLVELNTFSWWKMQAYFQEHYSIELYLISATVLKLIWAIGGTLIVLWLKRIVNREVRTSSRAGGEYIDGRIEWIDAVKGFTIILMVFAHLPIDYTLRTVIFSWHFPIFMLLSGYLFKPRSLSETFKAKVKGLLLPYLLVEVLAMFIAIWHFGFYEDFTIAGLIIIIKNYILSAGLGISFSSTILTDIMSVGPIWFISCLFIVNIVMAIIIQFTKEHEWIRCIIVCIITILGWYIGKNIAYMPHSADVALFSTSFFYCGYLMKKYNFLKKLDSLGLWVVITIVWLTAIYTGGIELATRDYPMFPLCILGAVAGCLLVIELCHQLIRIEFLKDILCFCGKYSIWILGIHRLEMSFCPWKKIIAETDIQMYFILKMIMIISMLIMGLFIKNYVQDSLEGIIKRRLN